jgi:hypothetical protein
MPSTIHLTLIVIVGHQCGTTAYLCPSRSRDATSTLTTFPPQARDDVQRHAASIIFYYWIVLRVQVILYRRGRLGDDFVVFRGRRGLDTT